MIGIIDADLLGQKKHRFPNLACEKISGYWKAHGEEVRLLQEYANFDDYEQVYVSKVFTDTPVPDLLLKQENVSVGGTGFYFDRAPDLPYEIEHCMPDYSLYDEWIAGEVSAAEDAAKADGREFNKKRFMVQFKEYTDYSIGFLTRGCFRKCGFCVNKKYDRVFQAAESIEDFYDPTRKKLCFLDDNFLGCPMWRELLDDVLALNKPFKFKQGLDERVLTEEKCRILFNSNYDGDFTFAFDSISDYAIIHKKLDLIRKHTGKKNIKFYVLTGFEGTDATDIENVFKRIELLMKYQCIPYLMRYQSKNDTPWKASKYKGMYIALARWCNQPSFFKKMSFRYFCERDQEYSGTNNMCSSMRALMSFEKEHPEIAKKYFDLWYEDYLPKES